MTDLVDEQPTQMTMLTPLVMRCMDQEYREGFVRGYNESAARLLNICDTVFAGSGMMQFVRDRFTAKREDAAIVLDEILLEKKDILSIDVEFDPALDIEFDSTQN